MSDFRLPAIDQRISVVGRTGSGKTQAGAFHLSEAHWPTIPYIIIDYKYDKLLNDIPRLKEFGLHEKIPNKPGVYVVHPHPDDIEPVEAMLKKIWAQENTGVFVDEGYMVPDKGGLRALLTQGRSKHIPMIINSQRPVWLSRFVFSESDFFQAFSLNHKGDIKSINEFAPVGEVNLLPKYHSRYFDVGNNLTFTLRPVPDRDTILNRFDMRMPRPKRRII